MEDFRLDSWPLLLGMLFPALGWLLGLAFYVLVAVLGFLGYKHTFSKGWMLLGMGGVLGFLATLPAIYPFYAMRFASSGAYIGLLPVLMGIEGLVRLIAGVLFTVGLFFLFKEHKSLFKQTA
jgi:hypothetical protein